MIELYLQLIGGNVVLVLGVVTKIKSEAYFRYIVNEIVLKSGSFTKKMS